MPAGRRQPQPPDAPIHRRSNPGRVITIRYLQLSLLQTHIKSLNPPSCPRLLDNFLLRWFMQLQRHEKRHPRRKTWYWRCTRG